MFVAAWVQDNDSHEVLQAVCRPLDQNEPTTLVVDAGDLPEVGLHLYRLFGQNHIPCADRWVRSEAGELTADTLSSYRVVFYNTMNSEEDFISEAEQQALIRFLDGGGMLVMSGSYLSQELADGLLFEGYMGANLYAEDTNSCMVKGADDVGAFEGYLGYLGGAGGYARPARTPNLTPRQGAVSLMEYTDANDNNGGCAAVGRITDNYKTVVLGFPLESLQGMGGTEDQEALLQRLFTYLTRTQTAPEAPVEAPSVFRLEPPCPNPFNSTATIRYSLPARGLVNLSVFDLTGRLVDVLDEGLRVPGVYTVHWNADIQPAGVYLLSLTAGGRTEAKKAVVVK